MATYDSSLVYCDESDVFRYARYTFDSSSAPTDSQVYEYAKDVSAKVESRTEMAGNRITPTGSLTEPVRVQRVLEQANAVGAALLARIDIFVKTGDERDLRILNVLAGQYESLMGPGSSAGGNAATAGTGGIVGDVAVVVSTEAGAYLLANEITEGENTLKSLTQRTNVEPEFTTEDVD